MKVLLFRCVFLLETIFLFGQNLLEGMSKSATENLKMQKNETCGNELPPYDQLVLKEIHEDVMAMVGEDTLHMHRNCGVKLSGGESGVVMNQGHIAPERPPHQNS